MAYNVVVSRRVDAMLLEHISFLANVSLSAAKRFRSDYATILERLADNPFQFPVEHDLNLPEGAYRKALFFKRYKAVFLVENNTVYLDAVVDCRQNFNEEMERHS